MEQQHAHQYASLYKRLLAGMCDLSVYWLLVSFGLYFVALQPTVKDALQMFLLTTVLITFNPFLLYHSIFCLPLFGGSVGKLATGLHVVTAHNHYLSFKHAFFRQTVGYQFSGILFGLGFLAITKHPKKQGWHDQMIDSYVVEFHQNWFWGLLLTLTSIVLSGFLLFQGFQTFWNGPVPQEYTEMSKQVDSYPSDSDFKEGFMDGFTEGFENDFYENGEFPEAFPSLPPQTTY